MPIVTISREYGAGGLTIGCRVAESLGAELIDSVLVEEVARRLRIPEEQARRWDERREGVALRLLRSMRAAHPEYAAGSAAPEVLAGATDPDEIERVVREVILEQARGGNAVIVGRGAAFLLPHGPGTHHFRVIAPRDWRLARVQEEGEDPQEVARNVDRYDRERAAYVRHHFGCDPGDPLHYCLVLNTGRLGIEAAARLVEDIARGTVPCGRGAA